MVQICRLALYSCNFIHIHFLVQFHIHCWDILRTKGQCSVLHILVGCGTGHWSKLAAILYSCKFHSHLLPWSVPHTPFGCLEKETSFGLLYIFWWAMERRSMSLFCSADRTVMGGWVMDRRNRYLFCSTLLHTVL